MVEGEDVLAALAEVEGYVDPELKRELLSIAAEDAVKTWLPKCGRAFTAAETPGSPEERVLAAVDRALHSRCRNMASLSKVLPQLARLKGDTGIEGRPETRKSPKQVKMELQRALQMTSDLYEDIRAAVVEGEGPVDCLPLAQRAEVVNFLAGSVRRAQEDGRGEEAEAFEATRSLLSRLAVCTERGNPSPSWLRARGWSKSDLEREQEIFLTVPEERTPQQARGEAEED